MTATAWRVVQSDADEPLSSFAKHYVYDPDDDDLLGRGAFSAVFYGADRLTGAPVAIKRCYRPSMTRGDEHRLRQEVCMLSKVDHPNVVKLYVLHLPRHGSVVATYPVA